MGYYCTVPQCTSLAGKTKNVKFHRFPRDIDLANKWNTILKRGKPYTKYSKVCSLHFTQSDYNVTTMGQWKTLSKDALPSQNLPKLNPDGTVMVIRKSRTNKYKDAREKPDKNWPTSHPASGMPSMDSSMAEHVDSSVNNGAYSLQTLSAVASALSPTNTVIRPKKQDATMQTDPVQYEEDDSQPNNSYSETSDSYNSGNGIDYYKDDKMAKDYYKEKEWRDDEVKKARYEKPMDRQMYEKNGYQKEYSEDYRREYDKEKSYQKEKLYQKEYPKEDFIPTTNEEYNKEAEKYALERKTLPNYEKLPYEKALYDKNVPSYEKNVPNYEKNVPNYEKNLSNYDKNVPNYEKNVPNYEKNVPNYEKSLPNYEKTINYEKQLPNYEKNMPNYEKNIVNYDKTLSNYEKAMPYEKPEPNYEKPITGYEKSVIDYNPLENGYQKIDYNIFDKDYQRSDYLYQNNFQDSVEILKHQQHNLGILQQQHRAAENQNFFNENHIKQEIDLNGDDDKFLYERSKEQLDASSMYLSRLASQQRLDLQHVKQEPDINGCEGVMQPQSSPYYGVNGHNIDTGYLSPPRAGPELLIAKQNALAAHAQLWQNTMKRPFFYSDNPPYAAPQLLHRYEMP